MGQREWVGEFLPTAGLFLHSNSFSSSNSMVQTCFVCLEKPSSKEIGQGYFPSHLIHKHGWPDSSRASASFRVSFYYWRFQYIKQCSTLLSSSGDKEEYLAGVARIPPFQSNPLIFPPDYSEFSSEAAKREKAAYWRDEGVRVENELYAFRGNYANFKSIATSPRLEMQEDEADQQPTPQQVELERQRIRQSQRQHQLQEDLFFFFIAKKIY
jgi:hypothetical protein